MYEGRKAPGGWDTKLSVPHSYSLEKKIEWYNCDISLQLDNCVKWTRRSYEQDFPRQASENKSHNSINIGRVTKQLTDIRLLNAHWILTKSGQSVG